MTDSPRRIETCVRVALQEATDALEDATRNYLKARGWKHTSSTPGHYWVWEKLLPDGRTVLASQELAVSMQHCLDAPEDFEDADD